MSPSSPIVLPPALPSELLTWILNHSAYPITILICKPRAAFLSSLLADLTPNTPLSSASFNDIAYSPPNPRSATATAQTISHPLLLKTLHQISLSRHISLIYVPTTAHLRAYLSTRTPEATSKVEGPPDRKWDKVGRQGAMTVVYGLVELHRDTSEWSAQGLSKSLAGLVEMGRRDERVVACLEERERETGRDEEIEIEVDGDGEGVFDGEINDQGRIGSDENMGREKHARKGWDEKVPMLNISVRRAGFQGEDSGWSGRTVEVGRIFARWFDFGKAEWEPQIE
ncbi:hypothetical protein DSL72_005794 [Monilinia vaccinii-corymbosi]|uniref:Uncharacterized protein n=1 Tax=Monilinia vaccinii-corymbosi TaxID=61207 RepID=A0A8A3PGP1_9HELO|nr:hypothetical protein DSL72_005794 [Monilinia vaccinii-corymbosi]